MNKTEYIAWLLFGVRMLVGITCVFYGGQRFLAAFEYANVGSIGSFFFGTDCGMLLMGLAPLLQCVGGFLILSGIVIELGTILVVPALFLIFFITNLQSQSFFQAESPRHVVNMVMLAITIGCCGPGKLAVWDPGKKLRSSIF